MFLSELEKKEMFEDASSVSRREDFKKLKRSQSPTFKQICESCDFLRKIIPYKKHPEIKADKNIL